MVTKAQMVWGAVVKFRSQIVIVLTPILLLPLPLLVPGSEARCGFALLLLATYWCTEVIPIAATALIPVFLFPMLGLLTVGECTAQYMKDTIMMFVGGLTVAIALEKNNLHKRIALSILRILGTQPKWLMAGFMAPTWFMSMWISNTATAAMMLPMVEAVLEQIRPQHTIAGPVETEVDEDGDSENGLRLGERKENGTEKAIEAAKDEPNGYVENATELTGENEASFMLSMDSPSVSVRDESHYAPLVQEIQDAHFQNLTKGFLLCVAYAANVGGVATLTGTPPNLILKGFVDEIWSKHDLPSPIDFPSWMIYGLPISVLSVVVVWYWMQICYLGVKTTCYCCKTGKGDPKINKLIEDEYQNLGPMRYIGDSVPAMMVGLILFVIPSTVPKLTKNEDGKIDVTPPDTLMDWETMHKKQPWGTHLLIGGGFALAKACSESGLADWIGEIMQVFDVLPGWLMVAVLALCVSFVTNVTSNSAMSTLLMPIMAIMAEGLGMNPLYLMFPVCVATSFAFMLPVGTPPNAIVFSSGKIKVIDMAKCGLFLNVFCTLIVSMISQTLGYYYFDFGTIPWNSGNLTTAAAVATTTMSTPLTHG